jgi:DNA-binding transcriptional MocR family regulator
VAGTQTNLAWETLLDLSATRPGPLHLRLRSAIRAAIRDGRLPLGAALPPSRTLATDLGVSRWTVTQAYSLLIAEGYLAGRTGSATRVSWSPDPGADRDAPPVRPSETPPRPARFDLSSGRPDLRAFPRRKWAEAVRTAAETAPFDQLDYSQSGGHPRLRAVLADHLNRSRGAVAEPGTISIFAGAGQSMSQVSHALLAAGHTAIGMEDPGSSRLVQAAQMAGLELAVRTAGDIPVMPSALNQLALAHFLESGDYHRHLRASRRRFRARRAALMGALEHRLPGYRIRGTDAGLDLLLELPPGKDATTIVARAQRRDMLLCDLDDLRFRPDPGKPGLLLGYGNLNDPVVDQAVAVLAEIIADDG